MTVLSSSINILIQLKRFVPILQRKSSVTQQKRFLFKKTSIYRKSLDVFTPAHQEAVTSTDPDGNLGEVVIRIPPEAQHLMTDGRSLRIGIEFSLEQPAGGLHFVVPPGEGSLAEVLYLN